MEDVRYYCTDHLGRIGLDAKSDAEAHMMFDHILANLSKVPQITNRGHTLRIIKEVRTVLREEPI